MATAKNPSSTSNSNTNQDKFKQAYTLAGEAASDMVDSVKDRAQNQYDVNKQRASDVADKAENVIKERPLLSVGCAFLAGWAVSKLLK